MTKSVSDTVLDQTLGFLKTQIDKMVVTETAPTTYASAVAQKGAGGNMLAEVAMASTDFTLADGDVSGRKVTVGQKAGVTVLQTGVANHVALVNTAASRLDYVTEATSQNLTSGNTLTFNAWDIEIADPT